MIHLRDAGGRVVTGHHHDVPTYVAPGEPGGDDDLAIGLLGRSNRHQDGTDPQVVHVEDRRGPAHPA